MIITTLKSNTPEWLAHRRKHNNASEAPVMMGDSPYATRNELLYHKSTGLDKEFTEWFQKNVLDKGHEVEAMARPIAEKIIGEELFPVSGTDEQGWLAASFDGTTMLGDVNWECKQWNEQKAADVKAGKVPKADYWQLQHQLAVNPGSKTLYMVTDGTNEKCVYLWVEADLSDIEKLKASWKQFDTDIQSYTPPAQVERVEGSAPDALPALAVQVTGMVTASNLREFEESARKTLASIKTDLQTDTDFADAEKTVKFCREVEKRLDAAKENVLGQMQTVDEVVRSIDSIKEETRKVRLKLASAVKDQKESLKLAILNDSKLKLSEHLASTNKRLGGSYIHSVNADFAGAMRNKRTITSLQSSCDEELARAKVEINQLSEVIATNLDLLSPHSATHGFLFNDLQQIIANESSVFEAVVKSRIADYEAEQEAKAKREEAAAKEQAEREEAEKSKALAEEKPVTSQEPVDRVVEVREPIQQVETVSEPNAAEIVSVIARHYGVPNSVALGWIRKV